MRVARVVPPRDIYLCIYVVQIRGGSRAEKADRDGDGSDGPLAVGGHSLRYCLLTSHGACLQPPLVSQLLPSSNVGLLTAGRGATLPACRVHATTPLVTRWDALAPSGLLANGDAGLGPGRNGYALGW